MSQPIVTISVVYPGPALEPSLLDVTFNPNTASSMLYDAWCLDPAINIDTPGTYSATLYSSTELAVLRAGMPMLGNASGFLDNLDSVNWLLNYYDGTNIGISYQEVQATIWKLLGEDWTQYSAFLGAVDVADIDNLYSLALANDGFVPDVNQKIGVILDPVDANGVHVQPLVVEMLAAKIGDRVWNDLNADGVQNAGEVGISGAMVRLVRDLNNDGDFEDLNEVLATTITDANGNYSFKGLTPGLDYQVQFFTPTGYSDLSPRQVDGNVTSGTNSDGLTSNVIVLAAGEYNQSIDSGFYNKASVGNYVWNDVNNDGIQNDGVNAGMGGVTLILTGTTGSGQSVTLTTVTAADGSYLFADLIPGTYQVAVAPSNFDVGGVLEGYVASPALQGGNTELDSNGSPSGIAPVLLTSGSNDLSIDFGYNKPAVPGASLGDYVWVDSNGDGQQNDGPSGLNGVTVNLYNAGVLIATTTTANDSQGNPGHYLFNNLAPGSYSAEFMQPAGYTFTAQDQGNDNSDSDANSAGLTAPVTLVSGDNTLSLDAGLIAVIPNTASIGDSVWVDSNGNGQQDSGELGKGGVTVELYTCVNGQPGSLIGSTTTADGSGSAALGSYRFNNLMPGDYIVRFIATDGSVLSSANIGSDDLIDSDADSSTGYTGCYTLAAGETNTSIDAGVYQPASLGDYVWVDSNGDGQQNDGPSGLNGVTVNLYNAGVLIATTTTANDSQGNPGHYLFNNLAPGSYSAEFMQPAGYTFTAQDQGNDNSDSDANSAGLTAPVTLVSGDNTLSLDAGLIAVIPNTASIGDRVWVDCNANGIQDVGEKGASGATVKLLSAAGAVVATTVTDANGNYLFSDLTPGDYSVQVIAPTGYNFTTKDQGTNDMLDSDVNASGKTVLTTLVAGENDLSWDAGIVAPAVALNFNFSGSSATDGTDGNIRTYTSNGVSVNASAFSRDSSGNWSKAWLGYPYQV